jgi:hypothetical protein
LDTKRRFPSRRRSRASRAEIIGQAERPAMILSRSGQTAVINVMATRLLYEGSAQSAIVRRA